MPKEHKCGVYIIEQIGTSRYYVGSSRTIRNRWYQHKKLLEIGKHHSQFLQNAWTKYGEGAFKFWIIEECAVEDLLKKEQEYLDSLKPEFNVCQFARSRLGVKHSPEVRARIAAFTKARQNAKTHCPKGHEYSQENTAISIRGARLCRACNRERVASVYACETPEQHQERLEKMTRRYKDNYEECRAKQNAYAARTREAKRAYDRDPINRARKQERRRMNAEQGIPYG